MAGQPQDRTDPILAYVYRHDPDRDPAVKAVAMRLRRAAHYVDTRIRRDLAPEGIELWEMELLATLMRWGGAAAIGRLQDAAQLTAGAMTNRITRLERHGYVIREIDVQDRRQIVVTLTEAGWQRAADVIHANDAAQRATLDKIDPVILRRLADDLRSFLLAVEGPAPEEELTPASVRRPLPRA